MGNGRAKVLRAASMKKLRKADDVDSVLARAVALHQSGLLAEAQALYREILRKQPNHAVALHVLGVSEHQAGDLDAAERLIRRALRVDPRCAAAHYNLGHLLVALKRMDEALTSFEQAIALKADYAEAYCDRGHVLAELKRLDEALVSYEQAIALTPDFVAAWINRGVALRALRRPEEAVASYERAIVLNPGYAQAFNNRGSALLDLRRYEDAVASYDAALSIKPDCADVWCNRGEALFAQERFDAALASHDKALAINPRLSTAWLGRAGVLAALRRYDEAVASYDMALSLKPDAGGWCNRGEALYALDRFAEALASHDRALAINPGLAAAWLGRANASFYLRRYEDAVASYDTALSIEPDANAWCNRGEALFSLDRLEAALTSHDKALAINPSLATAWLGRANIFIRTSRLVEAIEACNRALAITPDSPRALTLLGQCHASEGDTAQAVACYDRALLIKPDDDYAISSKIFALDFDADAGFFQHQAARACWWQRIGSKIAARSPLHHDNNRDPDRRIVIGYVSSDLRKHSAAFGFSPVLKNQDKTRFEVICYSCSPIVDPVTQYFQQMASSWRNASQWSDEQLIDRIRADKVDILIDLSGHSAGTRLGVFARKPAPIQVTAWGHSTGTGLPAIDYLFSDPVAIPAAVRHLFAEKIYDLPCLVIIEPPVSRPSYAEPPVLSKRHTTYGMFNRINKISDDAVRVWARILQSDADARMLIKHQAVDDPAIRRMLRERFARNGVSADRIDLLGSTSRSEHVAAYRQVDICLDPFPQSGGISTWEALHVGVPVVAKLGNGVSSRLSGAILSAIGLTDWVAADDEEYVAIALKHAAMPDRLVTLRHELPLRIAQSSGCDPAGYTRAVEDAYRAMWRDYCAA
jgi:predicted O-linked N-acetylglucosamine transferase (SPINDLY family)